MQNSPSPIRVPWRELAVNFFFGGPEASGFWWVFSVSSVMQFVLIIHEVADYPAWKKVFDNAAGIRRQAGERAYQVLKYEADPNRIVHFSKWTSAADARRFFESPELVRIRAEAGVKSPEFVYLDLLEEGTL